MKNSALSLAVALLVAGTAQAAVVTVEYSVNVTALAEETLEPYSYNPVDTSYAAGFVMYVGEPFTGRFTYDDAAPLQQDSEGYYGLAATHSITFGQSDTTIVFGDTLLFTSRTDAADGLGVAAGGYIQNTSDPYISMSLSLLAPAGSHAPQTLPTLADWQHYAASSPLRMVINANGANVYVTGDNISLQVSAVPEPATVGMTLAGLAVVAVAARRRKAVSA